ncbi:MAG: acyltransferase [Chloroflexi bacterium]|nr:acyltransferase [Chloroflexota bacterium]
MTTGPRSLGAALFGWLDHRRSSTLAAAPAANPAATAVVPAVHAEAFRPEVEGLRGIAVVLVVLFHADLVALAGGFVGVDVFFVISGFLITALLLRERERTGRIGFLGFYARRARRLMPAALVVLVVTLVAAATLVAPLDRPGVALDGAAAAVSLANIRFALAEGDYFTVMASPSPFLHFWSLGVEEQFYLVWPALLLLGARGRRPRLGAGIVLAGVLAGSLAACVIVTDVAPGWAFYSLPTRAWQLAAGGLLAIGAGALARLPGPPMAALGWMGLAAVLAAPAMLDASVAYPGVAALLPTLGAAALIAAGERRHGPAGLLSLAPVRFLGRISYSLYLWHWPILVLPAIAAGTSLEPGTRLGLVLLSVLVATLSWAFVEEPFRRGLPGPIRSPRRTLAVAGVALTFVISFAGGISVRQVTDLDLLAASASATTSGEDAPYGIPVEPSTDEEWAADDGEAGMPTGDGRTAGDGEPPDEPGPVAGEAEPGTEPPDPAGGGAAGTDGPSPSAASAGAAPSPSPTARPTATPEVYVRLPADVRPALARAPWSATRTPRTCSRPWRQSPERTAGGCWRSPRSRVLSSTCVSGTST